MLVPLLVPLPLLLYLAVVIPLLALIHRKLMRAAYAKGEPVSRFLQLQQRWHLRLHRQSQAVGVGQPGPRACPATSTPAFVCNGCFLQPGEPAVLPTPPPSAPAVWPHAGSTFFDLIGVYDSVKFLAPVETTLKQVSRAASVHSASTTSFKPCCVCNWLQDREGHILQTHLARVRTHGRHQPFGHDAVLAV